MVRRKRRIQEEETTGKKLCYGSKQSNIKGIKLSIKIIECLQPEGISPEEILVLLTGR